MASNGQTTVNFDDAVFENILRSAKVESLCEAKANAVLVVAQRNTPVDTGEYKRGLTVEKIGHAKRSTYMVVGHDAKTLLVESKTGNLAKALKAVGG